MIGMSGRIVADGLVQGLGKWEVEDVAGRLGGSILLFGRLRDLLA